MENKSLKKSKKPFIILAVVLAVMAGAAAWYWIHSSNFVTTEDAQIDGNIYSVRAGITAYLDSVYFEDNQRVKEGDTLFVFNTTKLNAKVQRAMALLAQAKAGLSVSDIKALASKQNAKASVQTALSGEKNIASAKATLQKAQHNFNRSQELLVIKAITQKQFDADKAALLQAKADYEEAMLSHKASTINSKVLKTKTRAAHHRVSSALALVNERKAELKQAREELSHAYVLAPSDGIVTKRSVNEGQYVLAGQSLCAVVGEQPIWVTANFKETQLSKLKPGQPVSMSVDAYPDLDLKGMVMSNNGATGAKFSLIPPDNATGNFIKVTQRVPVRIRILPSSLSGYKPNGGNTMILYPGLSVYVKVNIK